MPNEEKNLIDTLYMVHRDNSNREYLARGPHRWGPVSNMPLTSFVYEFFLYNSLYQIDWEASDACGKLVHHPRELGEGRRQALFWKYLEPYSQTEPGAVYRAFEPLRFLPRAHGQWTHVLPDSRISEEDGVRFFETIRWLQEQLEGCAAPHDLEVSPELLDAVDGARRFVYSVRNNIFHGSKTLGEVHDSDQMRRLEIYDALLKGITSLFFLRQGREPVAADLLQFPVVLSPPVDSGEDRVLLDQRQVWAAINSGLMKPGDSRLIRHFLERVSPPEPGETPAAGAALFYPSAGRDLLTPLLLGLPYCTEFFFYERNGRMRFLALDDILRRIPGMGVSQRRNGPVWRRGDGERTLAFEYEGIPRTLHWVHRDNTQFLERDVDLAFYFHRGDGSGEGGSGQPWDSRLAHRLREMIPPGRSAVFLTDGVPEGVDHDVFTGCREFEVQHEADRRPYGYHCGTFTRSG